jgi:hypothetical protein
VNDPDRFTLNQLAPTPPKRRTTLVVSVIVGVVVLVAAAATIAVVLTRQATKPASATASYAPLFPTGAATTAAAAATASVQQYAGAVNPSVKSIRESWTRYREQACATDTRGESLVCALAPQGFDLEAKTLVLRLTGAAKPGVPAYIGKPPAEISKLVADTITAAQAVDDAIADNSSDVSPLAVFLPVGRLMTVLDGWDPYL